MQNGEERRTMQIVINLTDEMYQAVKDGMWCGNELWYNALKNGTPLSEVIETIETEASWHCFDDWGNETAAWSAIKEILERHIGEEVDT